MNAYVAITESMITTPISTKTIINSIFNNIKQHQR